MQRLNQLSLVAGFLIITCLIIMVTIKPDRLENLT